MGVFIKLDELRRLENRMESERNNVINYLSRIKENYSQIKSNVENDNFNSTVNSVIEKIDEMSSSIKNNLEKMQTYLNDKIKSYKEINDFTATDFSSVDDLLDEIRAQN